MRRTRRHFLTGTGAMLLAAGLAGCGDGSPAAGGTGGLEAYQTEISDELDIQVRELAEQGGTVRLRYDSPFETDTEELGYEVGFLSARFGRHVADGWDVERLDAAASTADEFTLSWEVDAATARAFANDEITVDEFIERVFETVTVE